ncbi:rnhA [Canna indica]|uniref:RnhA n=1 Tax=Canna indica TaxID=4628 RepID=A0AAQ3KBL1_9LILI|nr:rnhA [Canna indica]
MLFMDDASNKRESRASIILENHQGLIALERSLQFQLKANNNQAKYEALVIGLKLPCDTKAQKVIVKSDFQLIVGQVNNNYQARDPSLERLLTSRPWAHASQPGASEASVRPSPALG